MSLSAHRVPTGQSTGKSSLVRLSGAGGTEGTDGPELMVVFQHVSHSGRRAGANRAGPALHESRPISVVELDLNEPGRGEVMVRIEAAGVCHSDPSVVDGNRVRPVPMLRLPVAHGLPKQVGQNRFAHLSRSVL